MVASHEAEEKFRLVLHQRLRDDFRDCRHFILPSNLPGRVDCFVESYLFSPVAQRLCHRLLSAETDAKPIMFVGCHGLRIKAGEIPFGIVLQNPIGDLIAGCDPHVRFCF